MERLTEHALVAKLINRIEAGNTAPELIEEYSQYILLAAYENTGLKPSEIADMQAENAKLRELLKLAVEDMKKVTTNVAFEGLVCGGECVHFGDCERVKNNDDKMYRCRTFKWRHADEVAEVLKSENT